MFASERNIKKKRGKGKKLQSCSKIFRMLIHIHIKYIHCAIELEKFHRNVKCVALCIYWRNMLFQVSSLLSFYCLGILFLSIWTPTVAHCIITYIFISVSANSKVMEFPIGCKTLCLVSKRHLQKLCKGCSLWLVKLVQNKLGSKLLILFLTAQNIIFQLEKSGITKK